MFGPYGKESCLSPFSSQEHEIQFVGPPTPLMELTASVTEVFCLSATQSHVAQVGLLLAVWSKLILILLPQLPRQPPG